MRRKAQAFGILAVFAAVMAFTGCANKKSDNVKRIGILQLVEHDALNDARKGFIDGLKEDGYVDGKNIEIQYGTAIAKIERHQLSDHRLPVCRKPE